MGKTNYPHGLKVGDNFSVDEDGNVVIGGALEVEGEVTHSSTEALSVASVTTTGNATIGGALNVGSGVSIETAGGYGIITADLIGGNFVNGIETLDLTNDVTLSETSNNILIISTSGISKTLTLWRNEGIEITIINNGDNSVTVKNTSSDTGVTATTGKTAKFITLPTASGGIAKITTDA